MARRKAARYNVRVRYTGGSPAQVSREIAERVAVQEQESYAHHIEGIYGEEEKARAEKEGLAFIAFTMYETRKGWEVEDLITGKAHFWPFVTQCPTCQKKKVPCQRGSLEQHYTSSGYRTFDCPDRSYAGEEKQVG